MSFIHRLFTRSKNLLIRIRKFASDYYTDFGYEIPIHILADKITGFAQIYTQEAYMRPLCVITISFSIDDERVYRCSK